MTNRTHSTLYVGMTGKGYKRTVEHIYELHEGFTKKYRLNKLVYFEEYSEVMDAINREKQLKKWSRKKKEWLINMKNPEWEDLYLKYKHHWQKYPYWK